MLHVRWAGPKRRDGLECSQRGITEAYLIEMNATHFQPLMMR